MKNRNRNTDFLNGEQVPFVSRVKRFIEKSGWLQMFIVNSGNENAGLNVLA